MKNHMMKGLLLGGTLALAAGPAAALTDFFLIAKEFQKTMPDGSAVTMWGYAEDVGGACFNTTPIATRRTSPDCLNPVATAPGPRLVVPVGEQNVRLRLTNLLTEPTSIVIPSQEMPYSAADNGPTWNDNSTGPRGADLTKRVRSFGREAGANGGRRNYVWRPNRNTEFASPGTFIYHSGTHPQKQVYMGLHGAITKDEAAGEAYTGVAYNEEIVLFYSDIDPDLNAAIVDGTYETSIHYHAKWFLVNGAPYSTDCTDLVNNITKSPPSDGLDDLSRYPCIDMAQTLPIPAGQAKSPTLLRFLSAASETHVPTLQGMHMTIHAEDGIPYGWEDTTAGTTGTAPREQYSVMLPPLKTKDAIIEPQLEGTYALYDGNGYMTNPTDPTDFDHVDPVGGMLRFLSVAVDGGNLPPVVADDTATVVEGRSISIAVLANDSDPEGQPLTIDSVDTTGLVGTLNCDTVIPGGTCSYTADGGVGDTSFTYAASDGTQPNDPPNATVTITVEANAVPVANDDVATTDLNTAVVVNVLANDTDANGDSLTVASFDTTSVNGATVSCNTATGDCTYTPNGVGVDTFTYMATDGDDNSASATVTVTVTDPVNSPPVAVGDAYGVVEDAILNVAAPGVLTNDTDADGDALTAVLVTGPANHRTDVTGPFVLNADGSFRYEPDVNFSGDDSFTYMANDGMANSTTVTVNITVSPQTEFPVATADEFFVKTMDETVVTSVAAPGVLGNDTPASGLTAVLLTDVDGGTLTLNGDGSFDYTVDPGAAPVGTVDSFVYEAQGASATSAPANVTLTRKLSVSQAVCEWETQQGGRCDWVIEGNKLSGPNQRVEAYFGGILIGATQAGAGPWTITDNNNTEVNPGIGETIDIDVRVVGDEDAEILAFPTVTP